MHCKLLFLYQPHHLVYNHYFLLWFFLLFGTTGFSILGMGRTSKFQATSEYESWNPKHEQVRDLRLFFQVRGSSTPSINPKHEQVCALAWYPKPKPDHLEMHRELSEHRVNIERALSDHQASIKRAHAQTHPYSIWSILFSNMSYLLSTPVIYVVWL